MNLVIVESPTKSRTISQFLSKDYKVLSSFGHIRDLPKSALGIDTEKNFQPKYVVPTKAKKVVAELKNEVKKSATVILATDEDREGEAIAWHLAQALGLGETKNQSASRRTKTSARGGSASGGKNVERIVFHEITKKAIEEALKHPRQIDQNLVDAQQARRVLDRLVGYKLSPFLWRKVVAGLSAGRVQSVALRLIADRENEIRNFKSQEYWTISALFQKPKQIEIIFDAALSKIDGKLLDKFALTTKEGAQTIVDELKTCSFSVSDIETKEFEKKAPPPFTTSTMQQEAAKRLGFSSKKTMFVAQHLYENGHITYMRTDSVNLSTESTLAAKHWLETSMGSAYAESAPRRYAVKSKLAQEAHEAIRPTNPEHAPETVALSDESEKKLYALIWKRFMASQMPNARVASTTVHIAGSGAREYAFRTTGQRILFDGYLRVWPQKFEEKELPRIEKNEALALKEVKPEQHFTEPPPRYSEATLIKTLEEYGIGRPSTYAPTISVIQVRNYVVKETGRFKPTEIGELVNKVLTENFPEIVDVGFTAGMEDKLDQIAAGKESWQGVITEFYGPFAKNLAEKYEEVKKQSFVTEKTDEICNLCGKPMVVKMGRFGKFLACSGFPECKNTKKLENGQKEAPKLIGLKCPKCVEGDVVERRVNRGRARGKIFWGCSRYPNCDYATWTNPAPDTSNPPTP